MAFEKAVRRKAKLKLGITGPSGSRLARAVAAFNEVLAPKETDDVRAAISHFDEFARGE